METLSLYELRMDGSKKARELAEICLSQAKNADPLRAFYLIAEADRHLDRAADYEMRASWVAPKIEQEIAA